MQCDARHGRTDDARQLQGGVGPGCAQGLKPLEESYRFAELVFPLLPNRKRTSASGPLSGPFGEIVGNNYLPKVSAS